MAHCSEGSLGAPPKWPLNAPRLLRLGFERRKLRGVGGDEKKLQKKEENGRLAAGASAPEFVELIGEGSALVVTGPSGWWARRQIHRIDAKRFAGIVIREDGFDPAAACA